MFLSVKDKGRNSQNLQPTTVFLAHTRTARATPPDLPVYLFCRLLLPVFCEHFIWTMYIWCFCWFQFDPLLVESRQAGTCVLMLDSAEDDVVIKATEAIYKFVEKCKLHWTRFSTRPADIHFLWISCIQFSLACWRDCKLCLSLDKCIKISTKNYNWSTNTACNLYYQRSFVQMLPVIGKKQHA